MRARFRANRLWKLNVCGAVVAAIGVAALMLTIAGATIWMNRAVTWQGLLLILNVAVGIPLIFPPGNMIAMFPYAAEIEKGVGVRFYAPFNDMFVPIDEIEQVRRSFARTGWVVTLKRRRALVGALVIHAAWGAQGRALAGAIEHELTGTPPGRIGR